MCLRWEESSGNICIPVVLDPSPTTLELHEIPFYVFVYIHLCVCVVCVFVYKCIYVRSVYMRASPIPSPSPKNHGARAEKQSGVRKGANELLLLIYHRLPKVRIGVCVLGILLNIYMPTPCIYYQCLEI